MFSSINKFRVISPKTMLSNIKQFVKENISDIILLIGVILISLLSFAAGYITCAWQEKTPIQIEESQSL
jgi:type IV secretory pathway VirB2 component (pilin)